MKNNKRKTTKLMKWIIATGLTLSANVAQSQVYHEECKEDLRTFMRQETNYHKLGLKVSDTLTWYDEESWIEKLTGITWIETENSVLRIKEIDWSKLYWSTNVFAKPDLDGILKFNSPVLEYLNCTSSKLVELDVTNNIELIHLNFCYNNLSKLNINNNIKLIYLCFDNNNNLTELDLTNNILLKTLRCAQNNIAELDLTNNTMLKTLHCDGNNLIKLNLSNNIMLDTFTCSNNNLTELDVSNNPMLRLLVCSNNNLTELDVSNNVNLIRLDCSYNNLIKLVSNNVNMINLNCSNNNLTELDVSNNIYLEQLWCIYNNLTKLDISNNIYLKFLYCSYNKLTELDVSNNNIYLEYLLCEHNKLKFSTLPIVNLPYDESYVYSPQDTIYGEIIEHDKALDLSSEYEINGYITSFEWFDVTDGTEKAVIQPTNINGVFYFTTEHINKRLRCKMENEQFPGYKDFGYPPFILVYEIDIITNIEEIVKENCIFYVGRNNYLLTNIYEAELFDILGNFINKHYDNSVIDMNKYAIGVYIIRYVDNDKNIRTEKVIKK